MSLFDITALLLSLAALFAWVNYRFIHLPSTIGLMLLALGFSLSVGLAGKLGAGWVTAWFVGLVGHVDFSQTLMHGMLSFLLFAGALHVNIEDLARQRLVIILLATAGVIISTLLVALFTWLVLGALGIALPGIYYLLFGALISPTDPVAVLAILKRVGTPHTLTVRITGESLFNDGVAVAIFLVLYTAAFSGGELTVDSVVRLFFQEAVGGMLFGLLVGGLGYWLLKQVDDYPTEILITLAMVMGGYSLSELLRISGPIAVVVAGILIGNQGRLLAMSEQTRGHLDSFWELIDESLNAVLFVLIGLEVLAFTFRKAYFVAALVLIPAVLVARLISVGVPIGLLRLRRDITPYTIVLMTWGGLRGGLPIALALSVPRSEAREIILAVTYLIVVFSIAVQGLTVGPLARRLMPPDERSR